MIHSLRNALRTFPRRPTQPNRPRRFLWLEELEPRAVPATIPFQLNIPALKGVPGDGNYYVGIYAPVVASENVTVPNAPTTKYSIDLAGNQAALQGVSTLPMYQLASGSTTIPMPDVAINSGRFVFSAGGPLALTVDGTGTVQFPDPNVANQFYYDFVEFTMNYNAPTPPVHGININTTTIDQFGIPITVQLTPNDPNNPMGVGVTPTRMSVIQQFQAAFPATNPFSLSVMPNPSDANNPFDILAPQHVLSLKPAPADLNNLLPQLRTYFNDAIDDSFNFIGVGTNPLLNLLSNGFGFTGKVVSNFTIDQSVTGNINPTTTFQAVATVPGIASLQPGMTVTGTNIPAGVTIATTNPFPDGTHVNLVSPSAFTLPINNENLTYTAGSNSVVLATTITSQTSATTITVTLTGTDTTTGLYQGMTVTWPGQPSDTYTIGSILNTTQFTLKSQGGMIPTPVNGVALDATWIDPLTGQAAKYRVLQFTGQTGSQLGEQYEVYYPFFSSNDFTHTGNPIAPPWLMTGPPVSLLGSIAAGTPTNGGYTATATVPAISSLQLGMLVTGPGITKPLVIQQFSGSTGLILFSPDPIPAISNQSLTFFAAPTASASLMVFACNGVFADNVMQFSGSTSGTASTILGDLENQVVSALNRGFLPRQATASTTIKPVSKAPSPQGFLAVAQMTPQEAQQLQVGMTVTGPGITTPIFVQSVQPFAGLPVTLVSPNPIPAMPNAQLLNYTVPMLTLPGFLGSGTAPVKGVYTATATLTGAATTAGLHIGMAVSGSGVTGGLTIKSITNTTQFVVQGLTPIGATTSSVFTFGDFYPGNGTFNQYSAFWHNTKISIAGKAYGFPYDDNGGNSSDMATTFGSSGNQVTITLGPWTTTPKTSRASSTLLLVGHSTTAKPNSPNTPPVRTNAASIQDERVFSTISKPSVDFLLALLQDCSADSKITRTGSSGWLDVEANPFMLDVM